ncbi:hypothetical protein GHK62_22080, partial [Sinorhizobium terangae]|nr:hypothetical protein [Sinorhizobium terangae]
MDSSGKVRAQKVGLVSRQYVSWKSAKICPGADNGCSPSDFRESRPASKPWAGIDGGPTQAYGARRYGHSGSRFRNCSRRRRARAWRPPPALWPQVPVQRCAVHKHRNLLTHAPKRLREEIGVDYADMIYARTVKEVKQRRKAFIRKWRLRCRAVADSLEEGATAFHLPALPSEQWRSLRKTNAVERLHEEVQA